MKYETNLARIAAVAAACALLTACGGGGGGDPAPSPTPGPSAPAPMPFVEALDRNGPANFTLTSGSVTVAGVARQYALYVPSDFSTQFLNDAKGFRIIISLHDDGQTAEENADQTRWAEIAENNNALVIHPRAVGGQWNTAGDATRDDDVAYIAAVYSAVRSAHGISDNSPVFLTGVGAGATMAQNIAMKRPLLAVGVVSIDGVAEESIRQTPRASLPVATVGAWQIRSQANAETPADIEQTAFWKESNNVAPSARSEDLGFLQTSVFETPGNRIQQVRTSVFRGTLPVSGKALSTAIWNGMFRDSVRFLDDDRVTGTLHVFETIKDMNLIDNTKVLPGSPIPRRWLTYLPSNYAALTAGGAKLPLVFSVHGRNGSARWQGLLTKWHEVAEKNGFIVIYPQGPGANWSSSTASDNPDVAYMRALLDEVVARYAVDPERVFYNGVSAGSAFGNRLVGEFPQLFAAFAPCYSGYLSAANYANPIINSTVPMPTWQCRGGTELPSEFPGGTSGETAGRTFWRETVNRNYGPPLVRNEGRRMIEVWNDGLAEYRWQITADVPHFWAAGQAELLWDEMFSKYRRLADGTLVRTP